MPEVLGEPPSPRTALFWNGTAWQWALVGLGGRLQVRGEDQLFSYREALGRPSDGVISAAEGYRDSIPPPAGEIWKVTNVDVVDITTPTTEHRYNTFVGAVLCRFDTITQAFAAAEHSAYHGEVWLDAGDVIRCYFIGGLVGDRCIVTLTGYRMTLEL